MPGRVVSAWERLKACLIILHFKFYFIGTCSQLMQFTIILGSVYRSVLYCDSFNPFAPLPPPLLAPLHPFSFLLMLLALDHVIAVVFTLIEVIRILYMGYSIPSFPLVLPLTPLLFAGQLLSLIHI